MKKLFALALALALAAPAAAVCPVCTIAVGAGLEGARWLGVDDVITGIWAGALMLSMIFWTANYMNKKGVQNGYWYLLMIVVYYALLASVWLLPSVQFGAETLWGIDKFLLGIIFGTIAFYIGANWHNNIKRKNGGKSWFPMQKVVWPLGATMIMTLIFVGILNYGGETVHRPYIKCPVTGCTETCACDIPTPTCPQK
jgi:hypothetical protein